MEVTPRWKRGNAPTSVLASTYQAAAGKSSTRTPGNRAARPWPPSSEHGGAPSFPLFRIPAHSKPKLPLPHLRPASAPTAHSPTAAGDRRAEKRSRGHGFRRAPAPRPHRGPADGPADAQGGAGAGAPRVRGRAAAPGRRASAPRPRGALLPRGGGRGRRRGGGVEPGGGAPGEGVAERGRGRPPGDGRPAPAPRRRVLGGEAQRHGRPVHAGHGRGLRGRLRRRRRRGGGPGGRARAVDRGGRRRSRHVRALLRAADTVPGRRGLRRGRELQPDAVRPGVAGALPPVVGAHARRDQGPEQGEPHPHDAVRRLLPAPGHHDPPRQVRPAPRLRRRRRRRLRDRALQGHHRRRRQHARRRPPRARQGLRRRGQRAARRGQGGAAAGLAHRRRQGRRRGQPEGDERGGELHGGGGLRRPRPRGRAVGGPRAGGVRAQGEQARARVVQHRGRRRRRARGRDARGRRAPGHGHCPEIGREIID